MADNKSEFKMFAELSKLAPEIVILQHLSESLRDYVDILLKEAIRKLSEDELKQKAKKRIELVLSMMSFIAKSTPDMVLDDVVQKVDAFENLFNFDKNKQ